MTHCCVSCYAVIFCIATILMKDTSRICVDTLSWPCWLDCRWFDQCLSKKWNNQDCVCTPGWEQFKWSHVQSSFVRRQETYGWIWINRAVITFLQYTEFQASSRNLLHPMLTRFRLDAFLAMHLHCRKKTKKKCSSIPLKYKLEHNYTDSSVLNGRRATRSYLGLNLISFVTTDTSWYISK